MKNKNHTTSCAKFKHIAGGQEFSIPPEVIACTCEVENKNWKEMIFCEKHSAIETDTTGLCPKCPKEFYLSITNQLKLKETFDWVYMYDEKGYPKFQTAEEVKERFNKLESCVAEFAQKEYERGRMEEFENYMAKLLIVANMQTKKCEETIQKAREEERKKVVEEVIDKVVAGAYDDCLCPHLFSCAADTKEEFIEKLKSLIN